MSRNHNDVTYVEAARVLAQRVMREAKTPGAVDVGVPAGVVATPSEGELNLLANSAAVRQ